MDLYIAHNTHNRPNTARETINKDLVLKPKHTLMVVTSDGGSSNSFKSDSVDELIINGIGHQVNCVNAFYKSVSTLANMAHDGVIIFSHDDVQMVNSEIVLSNINELIEKDLSYIVRNPINWGEEDYFMMEIVYLRIKYIKEIFKPIDGLLIDTISDIRVDKFGWNSAEAWLAEQLKKINHNHKIIKYVLGSDADAVKHLESTMGYTHLNYGIREWKE